MAHCARITDKRIDKITLSARELDNLLSGYKNAKLVDDFVLGYRADWIGHVYNFKRGNGHLFSILTKQDIISQDYMNVSADDIPVEWVQCREMRL